MVYNTLLELYLGEIGSCTPSERVTKERKALELLKRPEVGYNGKGGSQGREEGRGRGLGEKYVALQVLYPDGGRKQATLHGIVTSTSP